MTKQLLKLIESEREELSKLVQVKGNFLDSEVLDKSNRLDNLIVQAIRSDKQGKKEKE